LKDNFNIQIVSWSPHKGLAKKGHELSSRSDIKQSFTPNGKVSQQKCSCLDGARLASNEDETRMKRAQNTDCDSGDNDASPNQKIFTPRRRNSSILLASLRQDYSDDSTCTSLTGVARFVHVRSQELFFPDTSILFT
jgi:hypothetical protein